MTATAKNQRVAQKIAEKKLLPRDESFPQGTTNDPF